MGANAKQARHFISSVKGIAPNYKGIAVEGELVPGGGKGDDGKIQWIINGRYKCREGFRSQCNGKHANKAAVRQLFSRYTAWETKLTGELT